MTGGSRTRAPISILESHVCFASQRSKGGLEDKQNQTKSDRADLMDRGIGDSNRIGYRVPCNLSPS